MLKVRDLIQMLESAGWRLKKTKGSHRQFLHPEKGLVVGIVVAKCGRAIPGKTYR